MSVKHQTRTVFSAWQYGYDVKSVFAYLLFYYIEFMGATEPVSDVSGELCFVPGWFDYGINAWYPDQAFQQ